MRCSPIARRGTPAAPQLLGRIYSVARRPISAELLAWPPATLERLKSCHKSRPRLHLVVNSSHTPHQEQFWCGVSVQDAARKHHVPSPVSSAVQGGTLCA